MDAVSRSLHSGRVRTVPNPRIVREVVCIDVGPICEELREKRSRPAESKSTSYIIRTDKKKRNGRKIQYNCSDSTIASGLPF